jgi:hypothetical protein
MSVAILNKAILLVSPDGRLFASGSFYDKSTQKEHELNGYVLDMCNITKVWSGSSFSYVLKYDGTLWNNENIWNSVKPADDSEYQLRYTQVTDIDYVSKVWCSNTTAFALKTDGTLWCIGSNSYGQLGINVFGMVRNFTQIPYIDPDVVKDVYLHNNATAIVTKTGNICVCGYNSNNILGIPGDDNKYVRNFVKLEYISDVSKVTFNDTSSFCLKSDGSLYVAGFSHLVSKTDGTFTLVSQFSNIQNIWQTSTQLFMLKDDGELVYVLLTGDSDTACKVFNIENVEPNTIQSIYVKQSTDELVIVKSDNTLWHGSANGNQLLLSPLDYGFNVLSSNNPDDLPTKPAPNEYNVTITKGSALINVLNALGRTNTRLNNYDTIKYTYTDPNPTETSSDTNEECLETSLEGGNNSDTLTSVVFKDICSQLESVFFSRDVDNGYYTITKNKIYNKHSLLIGELLAYYIIHEYSLPLKLSNILLSNLLGKIYNIIDTAELERPDLLCDVDKFSLDMLLEQNAKELLDKYVNSIPKELHSRFISDQETFTKTVDEILALEDLTSRKSLYSKNKVALQKLFDKKVFMETYLENAYLLYEEDGQPNINMTNFVKGFNNILSVEVLSLKNEELINVEMESVRINNPKWSEEYFTKTREVLAENHWGLLRCIEGHSLNSNDIISKIDFKSKIPRRSKLGYVWSGFKYVFKFW